MGHWVRPIEVSLASPRIVWSGESMAAGSRLCVSVDGGKRFSMVNNYDTTSTGLITNIESHPLDEKIAYVLFSFPDAAKILKTEDLGETWTDLTQFNEQTGKSDNGYPDVATYSLLVMPFDVNWIWAGYRNRHFRIHRRRCNMDAKRQWISRCSSMGYAHNK